MKFRYAHTCRYNAILGEPYLEYETLFLDKNNEWRKIVSIYNENEKRFNHLKVEADKKRCVVNVIETKPSYNYYEYEIDIKHLENKPYKLKALQNIIIAVETTDNYRSFISDVLKKNKDMRIPHNWYGGLEFNQELGLMFPKIYDKLYGRMKVDLFATFKFICFDVVDFNKILEAELTNYNRMLNNKIKKQVT